MTERQFLNKLKRSIAGLEREEQERILEDYRNHFREGRREGLTEEMICQSLGNPSGLGREYGAPEASGRAERKWLIPAVAGVVGVILVGSLIWLSSSVNRPLPAVEEGQKPTPSAPEPTGKEVQEPGNGIQITSPWGSLSLDWDDLHEQGNDERVHVDMIPVSEVYDFASLNSIQGSDLFITSVAVKFWSEEGTRVEVEGEIPEGDSFEVSCENGALELSYLTPHDSTRGGKLHVTIYISEDADLSRIGLGTASGQLSCNIPAPWVILTSVSGNVSYHADGSGTVNLSSISGEIQAKGAIEYMTAETISGAVDLDVQAEGSVRAETVSGALNVTLPGGLSGEPVSAESVSGEIKNESGYSLCDKGKYDLSTVSGAITIG